MRLRLATENRLIVLRQLHKETALWLTHEDGHNEPRDPGDDAVVAADPLEPSR